MNGTLNNGTRLPTSKPKFRPMSGLKIEHLLAGISGGVTSTVLLHPLDLMKIRFSVSDVSPSNAVGAAAARPHYNGLYHAMSEVFRHEGIKGLYRGVTPNMWGAGSAWGIYFLIYNSVKTWMQSGDSQIHLGPSLHMLAAAEAGFLTLVVTNPIWVVKTRLCLQFDSRPNMNSSSTHYKGMVDAFVKTYKYEGVKGLYKGFVPGVFGVSHGAMQFMAYEELKAQYNKHRKLPTDAKLTSVEYLSFAALSKLFAAVTTYPYQVMRARMQDQHSQYVNLRHCIKETYRVNGLRGFYRGIVPYCLRVTPACAITFVTYEKVNDTLTEWREEREKTANNSTETNHSDDSS